jgi:hypothetical protein
MIGRAVKTKLIRNNQIIKNIYDNPKYDFNYQFNIEVEPFKIYKVIIIYWDLKKLYFKPLIENKKNLKFLTF